MGDRYSQITSTNPTTPTAGYGHSGAALIASLDNLSSVRATIRSVVLTAGTTADDAERLVIAVTEIVNNAIEHGGGTASVRILVRPFIPRRDRDRSGP
jgi:anti-sigma regulatory factor (Ser/Thr protein kinase)